VRVRESRSDELGQLASSINQMAERLAGLVNGQKRFLGDIAHELCSPLARAQVALGILENQTGAAGLADLREESSKCPASSTSCSPSRKPRWPWAVSSWKPSICMKIVARAIEREALEESAVRCAIPAICW